MRSLNKQVLNLAIPNIVTNITVPLVGLVDLALMGHAGNNIYIGAISLGGVVFSILYSAFIFLRMSTTGFTSQMYGKRNLPEAFTILLRSFIISQLIAFIIILFKSPIEHIAFSFLDASSEVENIAIKYYRYRIWAAPATLGVYVLNGWLLGMQNAKKPMIIALLINVVNIAASLYFVRYKNMYSEGVALGTVIAQYTGLVSAILIIVFSYKKHLLKIVFANLFDKKILANFFKVNFDILIRSVLLTGTFFYFNAVSAKLGNDILAINAVLLQFLMIYSYFMDGFAFSAEALVGKYFGGNNIEMLKRTIKTVVKWGAVISIVFIVINFIFYMPIIKIITNDLEVLQGVVTYKIWIVILPIVSFLAFLMDGVYIGATASASMRNNMIISVVLIFLPLQYFLVLYYNNHGLWFALLLLLFSRGFLLSLGIRKNIINKKIN